MPYYTPFSMLGFLTEHVRRPKVQEHAHLATRGRLKHRALQHTAAVPQRLILLLLGC